MSNRPTPEELKQQALRKAAAYKRLFTSPDGKVVLKDLQFAFNQKLNVPGDPFASHVRIGNYEVLQYITEIMEIEDAG